MHTLIDSTYLNISNKEAAIFIISVISYKTNDMTLTMNAQSVKENMCKVEVNSSLAHYVGL